MLVLVNLSFFSFRDVLFLQDKICTHFCKCTLLCLVMYIYKVFTAKMKKLTILKFERNNKIKNKIKNK